MIRRCAVEGCDREDIAARGMCFKHYKRYTRHGTPADGAKQMPGEHEKTFASMTRDTGRCIVWEGSLYGGGYGQLSVNGKVVPAHRYAWEMANGPIPTGMDIDHICGNRACVNVGHLRVATRGENLQNLGGPTARSTTGVRGVSYHKGRNYWRSVVIVGGKHYERRSTTKDEAARKVEEMRRELMPFSKEAQGNDR